MTHFHRFVDSLLILLASGLVLNANEALPLVSAETRHDRSSPISIDQSVEEVWFKNKIEPSSVCNDRVFVRRIYLDLCGRIPSHAELTEFIAGSNESKREQLVDRLLKSDEYATHFADVFDTVLMGRASSATMKERSRHGWRQYLEDSFSTNRGWDAMARDMTLARATESTDVRAGWFLYERKNNHQAIAESIAPSLLGIRVDCAQCHDHPLADEIKQAHYWGLVSFFKRGKNENTEAGPRVVESAIGGFDKFIDLAGENYDAELTFFASKTTDEAKPDGEQSESDQLYQQSDSTEPRVPNFSRREKFVDHVLTGHPLFAKSFVNRVWALLIGRGFVHPVDRMDSTHEVSHPDLLNALAKDFENSTFDIKLLVRRIVLSKAYQLESVPNGAQRAAPSLFSYGLQKPLSAESYLRSMLVAVQIDSSEIDESLLDEFRKQFGDLFAETPTTGVSAAMFLSNHLQFNQILNDDNSLIAELRQRTETEDQVTLAFEHVFGRSPEPDELSMASQFLDSKQQDQSAIPQLIWALLTSAEFRFNH